jgi:oligopeptide transport system ATP-binding protein
VMYAGKIVETANVYDIYDEPAHPYTQGLLKSIPSVEYKGGKLQTLPGSPPSLMRIPSGCSFHPRCPYRRDNCVTDVPPLYEVSDTRRSACHYWQEVIRAN